jgi:single-stranded-DNA-specific exonuclease
MQTAWEISPFKRQACEGLHKALNISPLLAHLLLKRGISTAEEARGFLSCDLSYLHDPFLLKDMDKAVARIRSAVKNKESILIYGDYDVDGLTATALLFLTLKGYGARLSYYIPDRVKEGYGLNLEALKKAKDKGVDLVIAVDCGITAVEEASYLKKHNIGCVVLDHHQPPEGALPDAVAVINPLRPDCDYPYKCLASVGLVFKLARALKAPEDHLDLVALGTISDVAPLTGENRILVKHGLKHLAATGKTGLRALIEAAGIGRKKEFYTDTVGFILGPRINASGRVSSSLQSLKLLLTEDAEEARALAEGLNRDNRERQAMQEVILKEAVSKVEREVNFKDHKVIVVSSDNWHPGVIGIVASRLVEKFYRPTILVAFNEEIGKGSGRSIRNFHLFDALSKCKEHLVEYGGHKHAAGITISRDNIEVFRERFNSVASEVLQPLDLIPRLEIDAEVSLSDLTMKFVKELALLEPYGVGNPKPVFAVRDLSLKTKPKILNSSTVKMWVTDGQLIYEAIGFKKAFDFKLDPAPRNFSLAFTPSVNTWQGEESIQLVIKDLQI